MSTHVIQKNTIELTIGEELVARTIQDDVHRVYTDRVVPMMDSVLTDLDQPHSVLRIERLELSLGTVSSSNLDEDLVDGIRRQLRRSLQEALGRTRETRSDGVRVAGTPIESELEAIELFLAEGRLPWWLASPASFDPEAFLGDILAREPDAVISLLRRIIDRRVAARLVRQFSPALLDRLSEAASGRKASWFEREAAVWTELLAADGGIVSGAVIVREEVIRSAFAPSPNRVGSRLADRVVTRISRQYSVPPAKLARGLSESADTLDEPSRRILEGLRNLAERRSEATDLRDELAESSGIPDHDDGSVEPRPATSLTRAAESRRSLDAGSAERFLDGRQEVAPEKSSDRTETRGDRPSTPIDARRDSPFDPAPAGDRSRPDLASVEEPDPAGAPGEPILSVDEALYIDNAGLVLAWPYLVRFFRSLDLVDADSFQSQDSQERGVLLLQHLGTGLEEWPEHQLPLNKLLCGWPLPEPVPRSIRVSRDESKEIDDLLESIIDNWKALKKTSVEGLRQSFLQREGRLTQQDDGWHLKVARTSFDVLLDQLPWGIGFVLLPWMDKPLFVEW